jgi:hypothetical protein
VTGALPRDYMQRAKNHIGQEAKIDGPTAFLVEQYVESTQLK